MFSCKYCSASFNRPSSIVIHEKACKKNPNRRAHNNRWAYSESKTVSAETRIKIGLSALGRKHTDDTKRRLSEHRIAYLKEHPEQVPYLLNHYSKGQSYPEMYWTKFLETNNIVFEAEVQVSVYRLDFAIGRIDLEVDGEQHYADERIVRSDKRRTEYLESIGWKVVRIRWSDYQKKSAEDKLAFQVNLLEIISPHD
jgi:hypothetical protein